MTTYVTTPIFYVNAEPHLGHAYTTIVADAYSRFRRLLGEEVRFQTGTDEHGDKIAAAALAAGITPQAYADRISGLFRAAWGPLQVSYDTFIRTTDGSHRQVVRQVLQRLFEQGDIVLADYSGLYCQGCERFLTEKELVNGLCPDHLQAPAAITEQNYFFKMSRYQGWLIDHIKANPEFITPERYKNEVLSFLSEPLEDLCISRPTSRLTWGIPLPFDANFVTYVWFDALLNYLSGVGYLPNGESTPEFARFWPMAEHIVAKDILKPHAIYWPTMLRAMGVTPYRRLHVHGYWNVNDTKMSKSIGNVIRPQELVAAFGSDSVRYFLLREMSFGLDASFSLDAVLARHNSDLANDLGNLVSRTMAMVQKFTAGRVPEPRGEATEIDCQLIETAERMVAEFRTQMEGFYFHRALQAVWEVVGMANRYIVTNAPWELAKEEGKRERLGQVIYNLLETLRLVALPLNAVMPETAAKMAAALGIEAAPTLVGSTRWGGVLEPGRAISLAAPLFPRLDSVQSLLLSDKGSVQSPLKLDGGSVQSPLKSDGDSVQSLLLSDKGKGTGSAAAPAAPGGGKSPAKAAKATPESAPAPEPPVEGLITFDEFKRVDLRVATVLAAEKVAKSDRLLKLTLAAPEERTVVAGIAEHYRPEEMVGRQVIIVANLKPTKLMGIESQGMVLAAKSGGRLVLSNLAAEVDPGSRVA